MPSSTTIYLEWYVGSHLSSPVWYSLIALLQEILARDKAGYDREARVVAVWYHTTPYHAAALDT